MLRGCFAVVNAQLVWESTNQRRTMEEGKESYSNPLFAVCWPCGFALVLLGLLRARRHGLLSFLISSAWSCPPDWWASRPLREQKWLAITFEQDFTQPPVMIFPTVIFWNGREAFVIFCSSSVSYSSMIHWVISWEISLRTKRELWMSVAVLKLEKRCLNRQYMEYKKPRLIWIHCIRSCLLSGVILV